MLKTIENLPVCPGIYDPALVDMAEKKGSKFILCGCKRSECRWRDCQVHRELKLHLQTTCPLKKQMQQMSRYSTILLSLENKTFITFSNLEKWFSRTNNNYYIMWSYNWKSLYHWRKPSSLGGQSGRYTIHTMSCCSSLAAPQWLLQKAWNRFFHFKIWGNNTSWTIGIDCCTDWFQ